MNNDITHHIQLPNAWEVVSRGIAFIAETYNIASEYKCVALPYAIVEYPHHEEIMFLDHQDGIKRGYPGNPLLPNCDTEEVIIAGLQPEIMAYFHSEEQLQAGDILQDTNECCIEIAATISSSF